MTKNYEVLFPIDEQFRGKIKSVAIVGTMGLTRRIAILDDGVLEVHADVNGDLSAQVARLESEKNRLFDRFCDLILQHRQEMRQLRRQLKKPVKRKASR